MEKADLSFVRPYGDTLNDGRVQLSLTLPVPPGEKAALAVKALCAKMGVEDPQVAYMQDLTGCFCFLVVYGRLMHGVDYAALELPGVQYKIRSKEEIESLIAAGTKKRVVVVGACIESDAHTVGIDAIINLKGFNGHKGLESYRHITAYNLGAQVPCEALIRRALEVDARAVLVSQVVTQRDIHLRSLTRLVELLEAGGLRERFIMIVGGPRITPELAWELGYDAGFGPGAHAGLVASFIVEELIRRKELGQ